MFWTTAQIAEATSLTQRHVGHLLRNGTIIGYKAGHDWIIQDAEAKRFIEQYNEMKKPEQQQEGE